MPRQRGGKAATAKPAAESGPPLLQRQLREPAIHELPRWRRLKSPRLTYAPAVSLPQQLCHCIQPASSGQSTATAGKEAAGIPRVERSLTASEFHSLEESGPLQDADRRLSSIPFPSPPESGGRPVCLSVDLRKKRALHPRLRWPRLALKEAQETLPGADGRFEGAACGGGADSPGRADSPSASPRRRNYWHVGAPPLSARPAVLPRSRPWKPIIAGTTSTIHAPAVQPLPTAALAGQQGAEHTADAAGGEAEAMLGTAASLSSEVISSTIGHPAAWTVDRKWFIRMSPISRLATAGSTRAARRVLSTACEPGHEGSLGDLGKYLSFEAWGLNDDYIIALLDAQVPSQSRGLRGVTSLNLSNNQLTEHGVGKVLQYVPPSMASLDLSVNRLELTLGIGALHSLTEVTYLQELNLSGNPLGDVAVAELAMLLARSCSSMRVLGLGQCSFGSQLRSGQALGLYLAHDAMQLRILDLHWNQLQTQSAIAFLEGCYRNCTHGGQLQHLNLAWNRLGRNSNGTSSELGEPRSASMECARLLAKVFADGKKLFHIDLSYNSFEAEECATIGEGLLNNHTLFGLHMVGNQAAVDDMGFVLPNQQLTATAGASGTISGASLSPRRKGGISARLHPHEEATGHDSADLEKIPFHGGVEGDACPEALFQGALLQREQINRWVQAVPRKFRSSAQQGTGVNGLQKNPSLQGLFSHTMPCFSTNDLEAEEQTVKLRQSMLMMSSSAGDDAQAVQRDVQCCWVCEGWAEQRLSYIPGWSGDETDLHEVTRVEVLFAVDGFKRPTVLTRQEEYYARSRFRAKRLHHGSRTASIRPRVGTDPQLSAKKPLMDGDGKVTRWVGVRMLPPSVLPMEVVFIVNGQVRLANDLPQQGLNRAMHIAVRSGTLDADSVSEQEVTVVNMLKLSNAVAAARHELGHFSTCLSAPRRPIVEVPPEETRQEVWSLKTSIFQDYSIDEKEALEDFFAADWTNARLHEVTATEAAQTEMRKALRGRYGRLVGTYTMLAFSSATSSAPAQEVHPPSVLPTAFRALLLGENSSKAGGGLISSSFRHGAELAESIFIAVKTSLSGAHPAPQSGLSAAKLSQGLNRCQLLRGLVQAALRSHVPPGKLESSSSCRRASDALLHCLGQGKLFLRQRQDLHRLLFTEDASAVLQEHSDVLRFIFERFRGVSPLSVAASEGQQPMSYFAWLDVCKSLEIARLSGANTSALHMAFALGKELVVDEVTSWAHLQLRWVEFLAALAGVVFLSKIRTKSSDTTEAAFADSLDEFLGSLCQAMEERVAEAGVSEVSPYSMRRANWWSTPRTGNAAADTLAKFIDSIFRDVDVRRLGTVELAELMAISQNPRVQERMGKLDVSSLEVALVFKMLARDVGSIVSAVDILQCSLKTKFAMEGLDRAVSALQKVLTHLDADGQGAHGGEVLSHSLEAMLVGKKMDQVHLTQEDVTELLDIASKDGALDFITVEAAVDALLQLHLPCQRGRRAVSFLLKELPRPSEKDPTGLLKATEVLLMGLQEKTVQRKLAALKLHAPDWRRTLEEIDVLQTGEVCIDDLMSAMLTFWASSSRVPSPIS